jgi:hypothetical protein
VLVCCLLAAAVTDVGGLQRAAGRQVAVKVRPDGDGRGCRVEAQWRLAVRGFPRASPLMTVAVAGGMAVHAEEWRVGGTMLRDDTPAWTESGHFLGWAVRTLIHEIPNGNMPEIPDAS